MRKLAFIITILITIFLSLGFSVLARSPLPPHTQDNGTEEPLSTTEEPFSTTEEPFSTTDEPFSTTDEPFSTTDEPSVTEEVQTTEEPEPAGTDDQQLINQLVELLMLGEIDNLDQLPVGRP